MSEPRYETLETCLQALEADADPQKLIAEHPDLRPAIEAAHEANQLRNTEIPIQAQQHSRTRLLSHAAALRANESVPKGLFTRLPRLAIAVLIALIIFLSWSSLMVASAGSLPGDQLYPVKRAVEDLRINLSFDSTQQQDIEAQYQERRIEEVQQLLIMQRTEMVSFKGILNEKRVRHWIVDEILVVVAPDTTIIGEIEPGMLVEVEGLTQPQGWVEAVEIHLREFEFTGVVETIANQVWIVSGQQVQISPETRVDPQIQIGDQVQIIVQSDDNGTLYAIEISLRSPSGSATPEPTKTAPPVIEPTSEDLDDEVEQTTEPIEEHNETGDSEGENEGDEIGEGKADEDLETEDDEGKDSKQEEEESESEKEGKSESDEEQKNEEKTEDREEN